MTFPTSFFPHSLSIYLPIVSFFCCLVSIHLFLLLFPPFSHLSAPNLWSFLHFFPIKPPYLPSSKSFLILPSFPQPWCLRCYRRRNNNFMGMSLICTQISCSLPIAVASMFLCKFFWWASKLHVGIKLVKCCQLWLNPFLCMAATEPRQLLLLSKREDDGCPTGTC